MADQQDIKDLENVASLANTDELLAIVAGLGKNFNWAKMKEQLTRELPVATNNSNGLMSASDYKMLSVRTIYLSINQEANLGNLRCKLYCLSNSNSGSSAIFFTNYFIGSIYIAGDNNLFSEKLVDGKIFFGRKETAGDLFVINKTSIEQTIYIV